MKAKNNDNQRFLQHRVTKRIFPYTENQALNPKFIVCTKSGIAIGNAVEAGDVAKVLEAKDRKIAEQAAEISRLNVYLLELEARDASTKSPRIEREHALIRLSRKDLMGVAQKAGIKSAPQKYHTGKEPDLVVAIIDIEFPTKEKE